MSTLDMTTTLRLLKEAAEVIEDFHGSPLNVESNNKERNARKAEINQGLLYAAHLVDLARADVMSQYHRFKGEDPPTITT